MATSAPIPTVTKPLRTSRPITTRSVLLKVDDLAADPAFPLGLRSATTIMPRSLSGVDSCFVGMPHLTRPSLGTVTSARHTPVSWRVYQGAHAVRQVTVRYFVARRRASPG